MDHHEEQVHENENPENEDPGNEDAQSEETTGQAESEHERDLAGGFKEGIRQGWGVLSALKDAIEETIHEAKSKGDLNQDRAKKVFRDAMNKAQERAGAAKDRFDFVNRNDFDDFVDTIDRRLKDLERKLGFGPPEEADAATESASEGAEEGSAEENGEGAESNA